LPAAGGGTLQLEAAPFAAIGARSVKMCDRWPNQDVMEVSFAAALRDMTPSRCGYSLRVREQDCERTTLAAKPLVRD
jgi:hypothetical protein